MDNWREQLQRAKELRERETAGMPSSAELLAKMAAAGELDFLDATAGKEKAP
jgi:hypothetical protein